MEIIGYIASLLIGISLGLIGGGGSILTVPVLVYLFGVNPVLATAYSLFIVGATSLVGVFPKYKRQETMLPLPGGASRKQRKRQRSKGLSFHRTMSPWAK